jgi:hypothetical protein
MLADRGPTDVVIAREVDHASGPVAQSCQQAASHRVCESFECVHTTIGNQLVTNSQEREDADGTASVSARGGRVPC